MTQLSLGDEDGIHELLDLGVAGLGIEQDLTNDVDGVERLDGGENLCQLSLHHNDEVQVPEAHVCAWDPADAVTSHPRLDVDVETHKKPLPGAPTIGVFEPPTSKFVFVHLAQMVCSKDTRIYTGLGETSLRPVHYCSCYRHLVCSRGYKQAREGEDPKSLVEGVNRC